MSRAHNGYTALHPDPRPSRKLNQPVVQQHSDNNDNDTNKIIIPKTLSFKDIRGTYETRRTLEDSEGDESCRTLARSPTDDDNTSSRGSTKREDGFWNLSRSNNCR